MCHKHGGSAPQVRSAADKRLEARRIALEAAELTGRAGTDVHPIEHVMDELTRSAALTLVLERHLEGTELVSPFGASPLWDMFERERDRRARLAKLAMDAGVDERRVRLAEHQGQMVFTAINGLLTEIGLDPSNTEVRKMVARHLRAVVEDDSE